LRGRLPIGGRRYCEIRVGTGSSDTVDLVSDRRPIVLSLATEDCFIRKLTVPRSALSRLDRILDLEISRATPFAPADMLSGWYELAEESEGEHVVVAHVIVRKDLVWPIVGKLNLRGRAIAHILVRDASGKALPVDLRPSLAIEQHPSVRRWRRLSLGAAAVACTLALIATALAFSRQAAELELLDERLGAAQSAAKKVRDEIDAIESSSQRIAGLRKETLNAPSPLGVWTELTRLLPDTAWLAGLSISERSVSIDGTAESAEDLIALLDGSPLFERVAFTGPVTKMPGGRLDRFSITFDLSKPAAVGGLAQR
jgi:general secretion pathway protein L